MRISVWIAAGLLALSAPVAMAGDAAQPRFARVAPFLYQGKELRGCTAGFSLDQTPGLSGYRLDAAVGVFMGPDGGDPRLLLKIGVTKTMSASGGMVSDMTVFISKASLSAEGGQGNQGELSGQPSFSESGSLLAYSFGPESRKVAMALATSGRFRLGFELATGEKIAPFTVDLTLAASQDANSKGGRPSPGSKQLPAQFTDCLKKLGAPVADLLPPGT